MLALSCVEGLMVVRDVGGQEGNKVYSREKFDVLAKVAVVPCLIYHLALRRDIDIFFKRDRMTGDSELILHVLCGRPRRSGRSCLRKKPECFHKRILRAKSLLR